LRWVKDTAQERVLMPSIGTIPPPSNPHHPPPYEPFLPPYPEFPPLPFYYFSVFPLPKKKRKKKKNHSNDSIFVPKKNFFFCLRFYSLLSIFFPRYVTTVQDTVEKKEKENKARIYLTTPWYSDVPPTITELTVLE
jgi:hypothetical protein